MSLGVNKIKPVLPQSQDNAAKTETRSSKRKSMTAGITSKKHHKS